MSYVHKEYPKFIYHKTEKPKIVHSKEEHLEHKDWKSSPADFEEVEEVKEEKKPKKK